MNLKNLARNPRMLKALTGLTYQEFIDLLPLFRAAYLEYKMSLPGRRRRVGGGQKGKLADMEAKLFFILFFCKTYPTMDVLGFWFGKSSGRSTNAVHLLRKVLERALGRAVVLPERKIRSVSEFVEKFPEVRDVFLDGTERRIQRPGGKRNRRFYSGKKKAHTRKNVAVVDEKRRILLVSPTKQGRRHDKRIADKQALVEHLPANVGIFADSGFRGIERARPDAQVVKRGSKHHPLTQAECANNRVISSLRMVAEHAFAGVKRYRVVAEILRQKLGRFDDDIMVVCAGLWNWHLRYAAC